MRDNYVKQSMPGAAQCGTEREILNITQCSTYFGLADLGFGCPELGCFSLSELAGIRLPFGLRIERDIGFSTTVSLSVWADTARRAGSISQAQSIIWRIESAPVPEIPTDPKQGKGG